MAESKQAYLALMPSISERHHQLLAMGIEPGPELARSINVEVYAAAKVIRQYRERMMAEKPKAAAEDEDSATIRNWS